MVTSSFFMSKSTISMAIGREPRDLRPGHSAAGPLGASRGALRVPGGGGARQLLQAGAGARWCWGWWFKDDFMGFSSWKMMKNGIVMRCDMFHGGLDWFQIESILIPCPVHLKHQLNPIERSHRSGFIPTRPWLSRGWKLGWWDYHMSVGRKMGDGEWGGISW